MSNWPFCKGSLLKDIKMDRWHIVWWPLAFDDILESHCAQGGGDSKLLPYFANKTLVFFYSKSSYHLQTCFQSIFPRQFFFCPISYLRKTKKKSFTYDDNFIYTVFKKKNKKKTHQAVNIWVTTLSWQISKIRPNFFKQHTTQGHLLSRVKLVWIQSFPFRLVV